MSIYKAKGLSGVLWWSVTDVSGPTYRSHLQGSVIPVDLWKWHW